LGRDEMSTTDVQHIGVCLPLEGIQRPCSWKQRCVLRREQLEDLANSMGTFDKKEVYHIIQVMHQLSFGESHLHSKQGNMS
jgi:hypothetical protein